HEGAGELEGQKIGDVLWPVQRAKKYLHFEVIKAVEVINVVALVVGPKYAIREPMKERPDRRIRELPIGIADASKAGPPLAINKGLALRPLTQLDHAARGLAAPERPHESANECP